MSVILPSGFESFIASQLPTTTVQKLINGYAIEAKTTIRLNSRKKPEISFANSFSNVCPLGRVLNERPVFTLDPAWHAGAYYVQEAGSMSVGEAVRELLPANSKIVLDLCAAPGGKSTHLRDVLPDDCLLVANELIRSRVSRLQENLERWGHAAHLITQLDPAQIGERAKSTFDVIVVDAPCSGEGLFRKDDAAAKEWSEAHVAFCAARQQRILADVWPALKPGGLLIYSTCTVNTMEDEDIVTYICSELGARCLPLPSTLVSYGIPSENHPDALRFLPDNEGTEGQFIAALQKLGGQENSDFPLSRKEQERLQSPGPWLVDAGKQYLPTSTKDDYFVYKEEVRLLPVSVKEAALHILSKLSISSLGVSVFEQIGRKVTPLQGLATLVNYPLTYNTLDLTLPQALTYLKREDLRETIDCSPGIFLATYKGFGLGWIKAIQGGRVNNLLPTNRRIRMDLPILE